jgi:hypothetical protein
MGIGQPYAWADFNPEPKLALAPIKWLRINAQASAHPGIKSNKTFLYNIWKSL